MWTAVLLAGVGCYLLKLEHQLVAKVERKGGRANQHLARPRLWDRPLRELQVLRAERIDGPFLHQSRHGLSFHRI